MTIQIPEELKTGTHFARIDVSFGKTMSSNYDRRFTYKRLMPKLKTVCRRNGKTQEEITDVKVLLA